MEIENIIRDVIVVCGLIAVIVMCFENGRRIGYMSGQMREMRQSMEDAGYVQREPKIVEGMER